LAGRVVRVEPADTAVLPGAWAVLHAVRAAGGEPLDSVRTDRRGRYRLSVAQPDTASTYLVSVVYSGIAYFSEPVAGRADPPDTLATLAVYDTSSAEPLIEMFERHLIIRSADRDGTRRVVELIVLANRGHRTRVAPHPSRPVWELILPPGAAQFEFARGDVSADAVLEQDGRVTLIAAVPPGERQLLVGYLMSAEEGELTFPIDQPVARLNVLLEDTTAVVAGPVIPAGWESLQGAPFRRFAGDTVTAGQTVTVRFTAAGGPPADIVMWVLVPLAAIVLGGVLLRWWRLDRGAAAPAVDDPRALAAEIAALDSRYAGREDEAYHAERAKLKSRLTAAMREQD
jgi:hypothetical protein